MQPMTWYHEQRAANGGPRPPPVSIGLLLAGIVGLVGAGMASVLARYQVSPDSL